MAGCELRSRHQRDKAIAFEVSWKAKAIPSPGTNESWSSSVPQFTTRTLDIFPLAEAFVEIQEMLYLKMRYLHKNYNNPATTLIETYMLKLEHGKISCYEFAHKLSRNFAYQN